LKNSLSLKHDASIKMYGAYVGNKKEAVVTYSKLLRRLTMLYEEIQNKSQRN